MWSFKKSGGDVSKRENISSAILIGITEKVANFVSELVTGTRQQKM